MRASPTRSTTCRPAATPSSCATRAGSPRRCGSCCAWHGAAFVLHDDVRRAPTPEVLTADFTHLRFHYGRRGRRGNYSEAELHEWAERVRALAARAEVFAYFNNDWETFAPANTDRLRELVGAW